MKELRVILGLVSYLQVVYSETGDFGFEQESIPTPTNSPLKRLWGIPDTEAKVGQLVRITLPSDAFEGDIISFKAIGLPPWLKLDSDNGMMEGVPGEGDEGESYIQIMAVGIRHTAKDIFAIHVYPHSYSPQSLKQEGCSSLDHDSYITTLNVVVDKDYKTMSTDNKIFLITNLARYFNLPYEKLRLIPQSSQDMLGDSTIKAGPGNIKRKTSEQATVLQWQVGCSGRALPKYSAQIEQVKQDAYDGSMAEVIQMPIIGWHLSTNSVRHRRQITGSGGGEIDNDTEDFDNTEDELSSTWDEETEAEPETRVVPVAASPVFAEPSTGVPSETHPHRHHHGESASSEPLHTSLLTSPVANFASIMPTPTYDPERPVFPTVLASTSQPSEDFSVAPTPVINHIETTVTPEMSTPQETGPLVVESSSEQSSTEALTTSPLEVTSKPTTEILIDNNPPTIKQKLPRQALTAGKPFRYVIPESLFDDIEDGNTRKLQLQLKSPEGESKLESWIYFNQENQEIIALPLEEHVSKWVFVLEARDKEGLVVNDTLELSVQHHKARRTVTHALTLDLALQSTPPPVEWELNLVERLAGLYRDTDASHITVLAVTPQDDPITFTWTNDSLPRSHCPKEQIDNLLKVLRANEDGKPTEVVRTLLSPQIKVVRVSSAARGACISPQPEPGQPKVVSVNYPPVIRNQVDLLNATEGQLLVYTVPEDTFYDPEDQGTRNLKISLLNMDKSTISPTNWLQFDVKNQEFYGIPMRTDIGQAEYQLVCKDSEGQTAIDGLVVIVQPAPKTLYNVEFCVTLNVDHNNFVSQPRIKRHFIERLAELFGDKNTSSIVLGGTSPNPTTIVWHNRSLPTNYCPSDQIEQLRQVLLYPANEKDKSNTRSPSNKAMQVLDPEFPVKEASVTPIGSCQGALTEIHQLEPIAPVGDIRPVHRSHEEYLVTVVVPAVVIAGMLLCAGLVACMLYRRRRTGKMSIGSEDERQSFRSKGIPVIFQDELEERPEPANKSPVIMKEEKPPLPPPEYHQRTALLSDTDHEDSPYQPPPPFTSSRDSGRPKPTPTYRMPPPYVPP